MPEQNYYESNPDVYGGSMYYYEEMDTGSLSVAYLGSAWEMIDNCIRNSEGPSKILEYQNKIDKNNILLTNKGFYMRRLNPSDTAEALFNIRLDEDVISVYAWCNLHGLWKGTCC